MTKHVFLSATLNKSTTKADLPNIKICHIFSRKFNNSNTVRTNNRLCRVLSCRDENSRYYIGRVGVLSANASRQGGADEIFTDIYFDQCFGGRL